VSTTRRKGVRFRPSLKGRTAPKYTNAPLRRTSVAVRHLSKEAFKRNAIDELWRVKAATSAKSLGAVILGADWEPILVAWT
jgi:hypothetical protein